MSQFSHLTRDQLERLYVLALERAAIAEGRIAAAELRAARAESDLNRLQRAQKAAARRRALREQGQEELAI